MENRIYARTGQSVSLLGYGTMRMPLNSEEGSDINYDEGKKLIDRAYRAGVNYFDTAYRYHGGESENFVGEALSAYPRDSFYLADKMPGWMVGDEGAEKAKDYYLFINANDERFTADSEFAGSTYNKDSATEDTTHFQRYGADVMAGMIAKEISQLSLPLSVAYSEGHTPVKP